MKKSTALLSLVPLALVLVAAAGPQRRVEKKGPPTFEVCLENAGKAWSEGHYGTCIEALRQGLSHAMAKRRDAILAALPAAPEGWTRVPQKSAEEEAAANPFAAGMMAALGNVIEQEYRQDGGSGNVRVTVAADSPMMQMFSMMLQNPAMLPKGSELIEYDQAVAILETQSGGNQVTLRLVLGDATLVEATARGIDADRLLQLMSQATVDALETALSR